VTSGIRIGSAAMTTRGFDAAGAREVAGCIADALIAPQDTANLARIAQKVRALCADHPVYPADIR
jgi:glycine hydroxymethyltransferase